MITETRWLYERTTDNAVRFVLGTIGANPLICFGINPSTAEPGNLDPTVNYVSSIATSNGYDSFVMLMSIRKEQQTRILYIRCFFPS